MKLVIADEKASPCPGGVCFEVRVNQVKGFSEIGTPEAREVADFSILRLAAAGRTSATIGFSPGLCLR
jgi:hypothetical protein